VIGKIARFDEPTVSRDRQEERIVGRESVPRGVGLEK